MKSWIVRLGSLYVFNVLVLIVIGWILPTVSVGFAAFWAAVILTAATVWVKPATGGWFRSMAARRGSAISAGARKAVEYLIVFAVAWVVWILVVLVSSVRVFGWFWGWVIPPIALLVAWALYDLVDDRIEKAAGEAYDQASAAIGGTRGATRTTTSPVDAPPVRSPEQARATEAGRAELHDGLSEEQRRMLDELGRPEQ